VLPSLINLRTLLIDVPKDMPPALSAWLIPRGVTVLHLQVARQATVDINVRRYLSASEQYLIAIEYSNYGLVYQTDSSSLRCPLVLQTFKISFVAVSHHSASCDSG
jgi:hypothetical protein